MQKTVSLHNLAKTAHDMQNLLMLLKAHTEGLKEKLQSSPLKRRLIGRETDAMYVNIDRLSKLMSSLVIYKDVKDTMDLLKFQNFDLAKVISGLVEEYQLAFPDSTFQLQVPITAAFVGDLAKITIVLRNLLENAIKYSSKKGKKSILVSVKTVKKNYEILIQDSGIGIAAQDIPKIFLPFYRGRKGIDQQGSGLGLAIAREIVQFHGGKISLISRLNKGTEVKIVLPRKN